MNYQLVYKDHDDNYGNWYVVNDRSEYAATPTGVQGVTKRRWQSAHLANQYMELHAEGDKSLVWLSVPDVCQGKPGATSIRHTFVPADGYKPSHGGYSGTVTGRMKSSVSHINEVPPVGTVHTGGNEEAGTIPDYVVFDAIVASCDPLWLRGLLAARSMFPKL